MLKPGRKKRKGYRNYFFQKEGNKTTRADEMAQRVKLPAAVVTASWSLRVPWGKERINSFKCPPISTLWQKHTLRH